MFNRNLFNPDETTRGKLEKMQSFASFLQKIIFVITVITLPVFLLVLGYTFDQFTNVLDFLLIALMGLNLLALLLDWALFQPRRKDWENKLKEVCKAQDFLYQEIAEDLRGLCRNDPDPIKYQGIVNKLGYGTLDAFLNAGKGSRP